MDRPPIDRMEGPLLRPPYHPARFGETSRRAPVGRGTVDGRTGAGPGGEAEQTPMPERSDPLDFEHRPVMVTEVVDALQGAPPGTVLDATVGGGGHTEAILEARPDLCVVGLDLDDEAFVASERRLARFGERATLYRAHFADLGSCLDRRTVEGRPEQCSMPQSGVEATPRRYWKPAPTCASWAST